MRRQQALVVRINAAKAQAAVPLPKHPTNGDDVRYPTKFASFTKGLPHQANGEVDRAAYAALVKAVTTAKPADFEAIPMGGTAKLVNPQAGFAFTLDGADSHALAVPPAHRFDSEAMAAEAADAYWQAICRDVPFAQYGKEPLTQAAIADLNRFPSYRGVDANSLFRVHAPASPGMLVGPYISQFFTLDVPFGATSITQRYQVAVPGVDFLTEFDEWLAVQNGKAPTGKAQYDGTPRYLRNGRDLGTWVGKDFIYQASLLAAQILLSFGPDALDRGNPYLTSKTQAANATFGGADILSQIGRVSNLAQRAAYYQKWPLHRRLRPEEFGGRLHQHLSGGTQYPIHELLLTSEAVKRVHDKTGSYLLSQAYPQGAPLHPAYPSAHATIIGACVTVMKAYFREDFVLPAPMVATEDGTSLQPYTGEKLTIGGELNKLMANVTRGRDIAGVHWLTDGTAGNRLGEAVALSYLRDVHPTYNERFSGYSLTTFDGKTITV